MKLAPTHYRHPAEIPTLIASLGMVVTIFLLAEAVMLFFLTIGAVLTLFTSLIVDLPLILFYHLGLIWGLLQIHLRHQALRNAAVRAGPGQHQEVHQAAVEVARRLGMSATPPVYVMQAEQANAFAIGISSPDIFITEALLGLLSPAELQGILGHEMGHVKARHTMLQTLVEYPLRAAFVHWTMLLPFWLGNLATRWWSRMAEYSADRAATIAAGGPEPFAQALVKMVNFGSGGDAISEGELRRYLTGATAQASAEAAVAELAMTHPLVERRLTAIGRFAASEKFQNCLAIVGLSEAPPQPRAPDPERAGVLPYVVTVFLAALYFGPPALLLSLGLLAAVAGSRAETPSAPRQEAVEPFQPAPVEPAPLVAPETPVPAKPAPEHLPATEAAPDSLDVEAGMLELARLHKARGEYAKARRVLEDLIRARPGNVEGHYLLAWVCALSGDKETARMEFTATANLAQPGTQMHRQAEAALKRLGP